MGVCFGYRFDVTLPNAIFNPTVYQLYADECQSCENSKSLSRKIIYLSMQSATMNEVVNFSLDTCRLLKIMITFVNTSRHCLRVYWHSLFDYWLART